MRQLAKTSELLKLNDIFVFLQLFNKHDQKSGLLLTLGDLWGGSVGVCMDIHVSM